MESSTTKRNLPCSGGAGGERTRRRPLPPAAAKEIFRNFIASRDDKIAAWLKHAIAAGVRRTRRQWANKFGITYDRLAEIVRERNLTAAVLPLRAESKSGIIRAQMESRTKHPATRVIRIPSCAIEAAGFAGECEFHYECVPGRITITPVKEA